MVPNAKILVCDDDPSILKLVTKIGEREGYEIVAAPNGQEAIRQLKLSAFNLVISDEIMPLVKGSDVCLWMRQSTRHLHTPFILMTAEQNPGLLGEMSRLYQIDGYLYKPFTHFQILPLIKMILNTRRIAAPPD